MILSDYRALFAYNDWASDRLMSCARQLSDEQWSRDLGSSFPSIRDTLAHIVGAEWAWLRRWQGDSPSTAPAWTREPAAAELEGVLHGVQAERMRFLDALTEAELAAVVHFTFLSGLPGAQPLGLLMQHVVNHSTYHRGQVATMLRQVGVAPPSTDLYVFTVASAQAAAPPIP